ncbi:MAG TPA: branched-chain amino acid ABC transporter ATP-binding protein/permease, partial [Phycisphaerae bacterium]|nr:branched-chain amino acid ABC transporter ATP-binding protein/permease [Phycisphaerae bacterium]
ALVSPVLDNPAGLMSPLTHREFDEILIAIMMAVSLNLILGMTGQFSLGHGGFMAVGAYAAAVLVDKPSWFVPQLEFWHNRVGLSVSSGFMCIAVTGMLAAVLVASLCGLLVGLPTLRLRGDYLAIATLGFGEIVSSLATNSEYLNNANGLDIDDLRQRWLGQSHETITQAVQEYRNGSEYWLSSFWFIGATLGAIWLVRNIKYSTSGRALFSVREDPIAAEAVGVATTRYKVAAFVIGAAVAGLSGALYAHYQPVAPKSFGYMFSVFTLLYVILGGQGSVTGSVVAAVALGSIQVLLKRNTLVDTSVTETYRNVVFAVLIVLSTLFLRQGLFGRYEITDLARWVWRKLVPRQSAAKLTHSLRLPPVEPVQPTPGPATLAAENEDRVIPPPLLEVTHVTMQFGGLRAIDDFNLSLVPGELVGLIGPNGAGKTTVFNVLTGVYRPTKGDIRVNSPKGPKSTLGLKPHTIAHMGLARTFQNIRLFADLSVLDNVQIAQHAHHKQGIPSAILRTPAFFREEAESRRRALGYLDLFNLASHADEQANSLSYGDQRRLEIARALATRPKLLLLDEPAAGMNPTEKRELMEMIQSLRTRFGMTILLIEHDMKVVMGVCQRIVVLDYGKTIAQGTPEEIRKNPAVIQAYLGASA